jgi:tetratricopeptide (TPR) repeat protein
VRDLLCKLMEREGKERGSWSPQTYGGTVGGRVFSTAMAILSLEVYYRYAPMYRDTVDEVLAAFGDALSSYNHFLRLHEGKKPEADDARQAAIEKLRKFLALSETRPEKVDPRPTLERRNQAAKALVQLHHAGDEIEDAIALLSSFPQSFPGALAADEQQKLLADLYRARARQLADASKPEEAKQAEATALKIYYPLVTRSLGRNPEIELWMAQCFFQSGQWEDALEFYRAQVKGVALKKIDPKSEKGQIVAAIYNRMIECCEKLKRNKMAAAYLQQLEELLGQSVATLRRRADLYRKDDQPAAARKIYEDLVQRLPRYSKEWWETTYDYLFMAYLEGRRQYVAKAVHRLQDEQPELGGEPLKASFLELLRRAEGARPQGEAPPNGAG